MLSRLLTILNPNALSSSQNMAPHKPTSRMPGEFQPTLNRSYRNTKYASASSSERRIVVAKVMYGMRDTSTSRKAANMIRFVVKFPASPSNTNATGRLGLATTHDEDFQSEQKRRMEVRMPSKQELTTSELLSQPQSMTQKRFEASLSALQAEEIREKMSREREILAADIRRIGHATCSTPDDDTVHEDLDGQDRKYQDTLDLYA
ncbi:hypothetical protein J7T55_013695 [Diaporthe amygdali]|uniref:uncharacterized protein n=1 Tax=Phomopsis amygdali TaxID=1214568 RepID=UPI0022FE4EF1|nr:uncharacterized protein J7T55_013695 [Diaporthe amygdali]KAJ0119493.1 hypothetical protein J7T55_013695 [Diaporthe amygdali]